MTKNRKIIATPPICPLFPSSDAAVSPAITINVAVCEIFAIIRGVFLLRRCTKNRVRKVVAAPTEP